MKVRTNFYVSQDRLDALKMLAKDERTNVSDLVREAIDAILKQRLERPRPSESLDAKIQKFLDQYVGSSLLSSDEEIDETIDRKARRRQPVRTGPGDRKMR